MKVYVVLFFAIVVMNIIYSVKNKVSKWFLAYEAISGPLLTILTLAYWIEPLKAVLNPYVIIPLVCIVVYDFYYSMYGKPQETIEAFSDVSVLEVELAKALSVAFTAPAYITAALLCVELFSK